MSNLSYCRFQNTLSDLRDCYSALGELSDLDELSPEELKAAKNLISLCRRIADDWEDQP